MWEFIQWLSDRLYVITAYLNTVKFEVAGLQVGYFNLILGFVVLGFIISVFWKGARQ